MASWRRVSVCEHPNGDYLVQAPVWMANVLELTAGFRLQEKDVILGYCNHQMLAAASCSATAIASGTWMNVSSFPPEKFRAQYEEEIKRKAVWYYCPQALSEYNIPTLDIAMQQGVLQEMVPPGDLDSRDTDVLFQGPQPTTVQSPEPQAFVTTCNACGHRLSPPAVGVLTKRSPTTRRRWTRRKSFSADCMQPA